MKSFFILILNEELYFFHFDLILIWKYIKIWSLMCGEWFPVFVGKYHDMIMDDHGWDDTAKRWDVFTFSQAFDFSVQTLTRNKFCSLKL